MRSSLVLSAAVTLTAVLINLSTSTPLRAEDEDWTAKAKKAWQHTCQRCHTAPDATYETGRAFLAQITETS